MGNNYSEEDLVQGFNTIASLIYKCEKSLEKVTIRTAQKTLLVNRIKALKIASSLIQKELENKKGFTGSV